jgi:hypothetical protein
MEVVRYYLYISRSKVSMLFAQQTPAASYKQKLDLKILSVERSSPEQNASLVANVETVETSLRAAGLVRESIDVRRADPLPPYIHDVGDWRISVIKKAYEDSEPEPPWAYCLFRQRGPTAYFLLGSVDNIITQLGAQQRPTAISPSATVDEYIMGLIARSAHQSQNFESRRVVGLLDYCARMCMTFPEYNSEVLFKTYWHLKVTKQDCDEYRQMPTPIGRGKDVAQVRRILIGSPIYAAMSDLW